MKREIFFIAVCLLFASSVFAQETIPDGNESIKSENASTQHAAALEIIKFFPKEIALGDVAFNIQIKNNRDLTLENVYAFISGSGFSTYAVIPIDTLGPFEKDYIFVNGNVKESGQINLTVRIADYVFNQPIFVVDTTADINTTSEETNQKKLIVLSEQLEQLKKNYSELELEISEKRDMDYDVSGIDLEDLKRYLRDVESFIFIGDAGSASVNFKLANEEYRYQKSKVDKAKIIPVLTRLKENALIFSAIFGSILAFFALSELLKQKSERVYSEIKKTMGHRTLKGGRL
ncbi:MAG: hypothetical protein AABX16_00670 [Nanoarchaeota archaeon]